MNWYYATEGRSQGPLTESSLKRLAREGVISAGTLVWHPGLEEWEPLAKLKPEIVESLNKGVTARPPDGKSGRIPLPEQGGQQAAEAGVLKRLFGWRRKNPE